jgi:uncharacterized membrane protein YsdA (DUF1294 family)
LIGLTYAALSLVTLLTYGLDKLQAKRGGRRVPEARLHALALLGGFAGAWLGRRLFRHKTQKPGFGFVLVLALVLHALAWGGWFAGRTTGAP